MNKFKEEPKWVVSYNQQPCTTRWIVVKPNKILKIEKGVSKIPGQDKAKPNNIL